MRRTFALAAAWLFCAGVPAFAQTDGVLRRGAIEIDAGALWQGGLPMGDTRATLTGNQTGLPPVTLFNTSSRFEPAPGVEARLAVHLSRLFAIEGGFRYARPRLETRISDDFENAQPTTATQDITQYVLDVNAVAHLSRLGSGGRFVPFVFAGGGYLRELYDGRQVVETGQIYQAGGGVKVLFSQSRRRALKGLGLRLDARALMRRGGVELQSDEPLRTSAAGGASLVLVF